MGIVYYVKNKYKGYSLRKKLYVVFLAGILLYIVLFGIYIQLMYHLSLEKEYLESRERVVSEFYDGLHSELSIVSNMSISIMKNIQIREYLNEANPSLNQSNQIRENLYQFVNLEDYVESIFLIHPNGRVISINYVGMDGKRKNQFTTEWKKDLSALKGEATFALNADKGFTNGSYDVLSHMRAIYDMDSQELIGYLVINLSMKFFEEKIEQSWEEGDTFIGICNELWELETFKGEREIGNSCIKLLSKENQSDWKGIIQRHAVIQKPILDSGLSIIYVSKLNMMKIFSVNLVLLAILVVLLTAAFFAVLGKVISVTITRPIAVLAQYMERVKNGYLYRVTLKTNDDEIGMLKDTYNRMLVQTNSLITRLVDEEKQKQQLELDVLQEQINPHFLYNTLSTIEYYVLSDKKEEVHHALHVLADFYRNFLSGGSKVISLKKEIAIVQDYMELQRLRFDNCVTLDIQIEEEMYSALVPRLILQPLIENSLVHGIYPKGEEGVILIRASRTENQMRLEIQDNGIGLDVKQILEMLHRQSENKKHFGLQGTILRIHYFYGIDDFYEIQSEIGQYTKICFKLPLIYEIEDMV